MSFIESVLYYTKDSESPKRYYYWSALAAIAAVVKDNVYLDRFYSKLYPNIYVLLVGRSGLRKGPPVNLAKFLVTNVNNTKIYAGRVSIQGVIADLSKAKTSKNGGPPSTDTNGFLVASEFASFIIRDPDALTILTDLYDRHYNETAWTYLLRNSPEEKLNKPTITMLGASNEVHLIDAIPKNAIGGGFIARTFIVHADKKSGVNALMYKPADTIPLANLLAELSEISKCKGEFKLSEDAKKLYELWYRRLQEMEDLADDTTGTLERLHDHVLKTAMLVSLSNRRDLTITTADIKESIHACQAFTPAARRITIMQVGAAKSAPGTSVLLMALINAETHRITRTEALQKHWSHFSAPELDSIIEDLVAQKAITVTLGRDDKGRPEVVYSLNPKVLERYQAKQQKKD
jgi:Protein of unknown function (DUF3987)